AVLLAVQSCLPVDGGRIRMRDLAAAAAAFSALDPEESVGFAPAPGSQRRFSAGELERLAVRKGIRADSEPVCFERKLESLTKEQVIAALRESLPEGAQMELIEFSQTRIPKGAIEFPRSGLTQPRPTGPRQP